MHNTYYSLFCATGALTTERDYSGRQARHYLRQAPHSQITQRKRQRLLVSDALAAGALSENALSSTAAFASLIPSLFRLPLHAASESIARDHSQNCHHHAAHLMKSPNPFAACSHNSNLTHSYSHSTHASNTVDAAAPAAAAANPEEAGAGSSHRRSSVKSAAGSDASPAHSHSKLHDLLPAFLLSRRCSDKQKQHKRESSKATIEIVHTMDILAALRVRAEQNFPRLSSLETSCGSARPVTIQLCSSSPVSSAAATGPFLAATVPRARAAPTVSAPERAPLLGTMRAFNRSQGQGRLSSHMFERKVAPGTRVKLDDPNSPLKTRAGANESGTLRNSKVFLPLRADLHYSSLKSATAAPPTATVSVPVPSTLTLPVPESDVPAISVTGTSGSEHSVPSRSSKEPSPALSGAGAATETEAENESEREASVPLAAGGGDGELPAIDRTTSMLQLAGAGAELELVPVAPCARPESHAADVEGGSNSDVTGDVSGDVSTALRRADPQHSAFVRNSLHRRSLSVGDLVF